MAEDETNDDLSWYCTNPACDGRRDAKPGKPCPNCKQEGWPIASHPRAWREACDGADTE